MKNIGFHATRLGLATCLIGGFTPVLAQTVDPEAADLRRDDIVVTASRSGNGIDRNLIGSSVTIVDARDLADRETRIVSDVLRDIPGVSVSRIGAVGGQTQIRIRGAEGNHVLVLVDGIKVSDPYQGEFDFGTLIADDAARIEVLRGQQSALYGSDAIGGVINYISLSGRDAPGVRLRAEGGSFGTYNGTARAAGVASDTFDYALSGSFYHTDGYPTAVYHSDVGPLQPGERDIGSESYSLSGKVNWTPADNVRVTGVMRYGHTTADTNDSANGPIEVDGYPVGSTIDTPGVYYKSRMLAGLLRAELTSFDGVMTTAASIQLSGTRRDGIDPSPYGYGDYGNNGTRYRGSLENTVRFGNERVKNVFTLAIDAEREEYRNTKDPYTILFEKHRFDTMGVVAQYNMVVDERLSLNGSVRVDMNDKFNDDITWHFDGSYLAATGTRVHAAAGKGVKNPTATELFGYYPPFVGNPTLRPEQSEGWEAGLDQSFADGIATIGATYFKSRLTDWITTCYASTAPYASTPCNRAGVTRQQGVEVFGQVRLGAVRLDAAYTYLDAAQTQSVFTGTVDAQSVRRPKHSGSVNVTYAPETLPFSTTLTVRHNGAMNDLAFGNAPPYPSFLVHMPAFTLVNLAARYKLLENVDIYARAENLFDETYQEVFTFMAPGRTVYGGVRLRF